MKKQFTLKSLHDWEKVVETIFPLLNHKILLLKGDLGAGKTTFTQFLLKKIGSEDIVSSPTYAIVNEYSSEKGKIFHFDLYRLKSLQEVYDIGIEDYLDEGYLSIIEWPEIYEEELLGYSFHLLQIEKRAEDRWVEFQ